MSASLSQTSSYRAGMNTLDWGWFIINKLKKIPYKFVHVIWIDIVSDSAWRSIDEVKESKCPRCLSTGFLIEDDDEVIRLVSDFNFDENGSIDDCGNSTIIPKCVVQEVTEVK